MPSGQTFIVRQHTRDLIKSKVATVPEGFVVNIQEPKRTLDQNARMWAMLSDVSRACPEGRRWDTNTWKAAFMHALGHEILWQPGLDGQTPFPAGFRTSKLNKRQMADLITVIQEYGDRHGVRWTEPPREEAA